MASWHRFAEHGDPAKDGNCRWCGRKLRRKTWRIPETEEVPRGYHLTGKTGNELGRTVRTVAADALGDYQDGHFCGLRCGYEFGVDLANKGRRLVPAL